MITMISLWHYPTSTTGGVGGPDKRPHIAAQGGRGFSMGYETISQCAGKRQTLHDFDFPFLFN
jgi:hypothetical protein